MRQGRLGAALVAVVLAAGGPVPALTFFSVGTGDLDGGYFRVASAICGAVNAAAPGVLRCSPEATQGSIYNLFALRDRQLDLAIVQSDWQAHAVQGSSVFADTGPMADLRSVMALHREPVTLLVRREAGIFGFDDLIGRRVDIGHPASGRRATANRIMEAKGIDTAAFAELRELQTGPALAELCAGRIDATILVTGHPNPTIGRAMADCNLVIAELRGPDIDALVAAGEGFVASYIPLASYPQLTRDVPTMAVQATLVARADTPDAAVAAVVIALRTSLDAIAQREPLLAGLDPAAMATSGLIAPMHRAAAAAFAEDR